MSALNEQLAALGTMSPAHLREKWQKVTGAPVPKVSPSLLRLALAYELQATPPCPVLSHHIRWCFPVTAKRAPCLSCEAI